MALANGKVSFTETDLEKCVLKLVKNLSNRDTAFITLIYGADITDDQASKVEAALSAKMPDVEITLINGGQPVYYFIISVE